MFGDKSPLEPYTLSRFTHYFSILLVLLLYCKSIAHSNWRGCLYFLYTCAVKLADEIEEILAHSFPEIQQLGIDEGYPIVFVMLR